MTKEFSTKVKKFLDERTIYLEVDERLKQNVLTLELLRMLWKGKFDDNKELIKHYKELRKPDYYNQDFILTDGEILWDGRWTTINSIMEIIEFSNGINDNNSKPNKNENLNNSTLFY